MKRSGSLDKEEFIKGKEVILSAGAVGSPHILLLSGIGPQEELQKHDIPVIVDLPSVNRARKYIVDPPDDLFSLDKQTKLNM